MGHTAYNSATVIEKLPLKIESIAVWGDRIVVGTFEGVLLIYEIKKNDQPGGQYSVSLFDAHKTFSKKPISELTVIDEFNLLISLSDGVISVHDLPSFALRSQLNKAKGSHLYSIQQNGGSLMLCAAMRKKLVIFTWEGSDFVEMKELLMPDMVKSLLWAGDSLCIGWKKEYNLIHVQTGARTDLFPTGKSGNALATLVPNDQILLGRDQISIFIGFDGKPTQRYGISWSETPILFGYSYPYVIGVLSKGIEIRTLSQNLVQTIPLKIPKLLAIKGGNIYIAAPNHVWKLSPVSMIEQVDQLVAEKEYEEALLLCENIPEDDSQKKEKIKSIKILYSYHLFCQGQYTKALDFFSELQCDPLQVIGLYPNLLPREIREKHKYPIEIPELAGTVLEKALSALIQYLIQIRVPVEKEKGKQVNEGDYNTVTDVPTIIDTSLLKAFVKSNDDELSKFLKMPNLCHVKECESVLSHFKKYRELVLLFKGKNLHRRALDLLSKLGQLKGSGFGAAETVKYLCELGKAETDLILDFSKWVLQSSPEEALLIFTHNRNEENSLPSEKVVSHIKQYAPQQAVPFLEFTVHTRKETDPHFHNELIHYYLERVISLKKSSPPYDEDKVAAGSEPGALGELRSKFLDFLDKSKYYNPEKILTKFPYNELFEERAILMSRIGEHEKALQIYAIKLKNFQMAEKYCAKHFNIDKEDSRDVYLSLLRVYLRPEKGEPTVQPALELLNKYFHFIDVAKAIELLPMDTAISKLFPLFQAVLRNNSKNKRNNQVIKNLLKSENLQVREQLIHARSRVVKVNEGSLCRVCNKRLGLSAFASYPNGVTVHYNCYIIQKDKNICPVTGTIFNQSMNQNFSN